MKIYQGHRLDCFRVMVTVDGGALPPRLDLCNHSPDGYNWGYAGSGPAQLAFAILLDYLGDETRAMRLHQTFKFELIAHFADEWIITGDDIAGWLTAHGEIA